MVRYRRNQASPLRFHQQIRPLNIVAEETNLTFLNHRKFIDAKFLGLCSFSGTWSTPDVPTPSNVVRITKAILRETDEGVKQDVFYDAGLGTGNLTDRLLGGALGVGIDINIKQLYSYLAMNYDEGDEIYMFGYSRGSYTIRSLCGLINDCGLVRREHVERVDEAYELYRENLDAGDPRLLDFRAQYGDRVKITLLACFDTVGSLGIPDSFNFLSGLNRDRYEFHDTKLSDIIQNAVHILSIDEDNSAFKPTFMEANAAVINQVTQLYFWGRHGGVAGSDPNMPEAGEITLKFLVDEINGARGLGLQFDMNLIPDVVDVSREVETSGGNFLFGILGFFIGSYVRPISSVEQLSESAIVRYQTVSSWRPAALQKLEEAILNYKV